MYGILYGHLFLESLITVDLIRFLNEDVDPQSQSEKDGGNSGVSRRGLIDAVVLYIYSGAYILI